MLAYVFWHWKQPQVAPQIYEERQQAFHAALKSAPPRGFLESFSFGVQQAAWTQQEGEVYEDWYLVEDFAALGLLNEAAVTGSRSSPHSSAAAFLAGGAAGLYELQLGCPEPQARHAYWFYKPQGLSYSDFIDQFSSLVEANNAALWKRQMVFGPTAEFCLHAKEPVSFSSPISPSVHPLRPLWA